MGRPGRQCVARLLPELCVQRGVDFVLANAENAAGGMGATPDVLRDLRKIGIHAFTMGNHVWRKEELVSAIGGMPDVVRPANYPKKVPGQGSALIRLGDGRAVGVANLLGRVFMDPLDCPFETADREVARLREQTPVVIVDMHAEATSEKAAMAWYLDGRCTAVAGTHTHVQTADEWVLPKGTAFITDVGMCGPIYSVIGMDRDRIMERFLTAMPQKFEVAKGPAMFNAVLIEADEHTGRALMIERIFIRETFG